MSNVLTTDDLKRLRPYFGALLRGLLLVVGPTVVALIGFGEMRQRAADEQRLARADLAEIERRTSKIEERLEEDRKEQARTDAMIREALAGLQLELAKLCARFRCDKER